MLLVTKITIWTATSLIQLLVHVKQQFYLHFTAKPRKQYGITCVSELKYLAKLIKPRWQAHIVGSLVNLPTSFCENLLGHSIFRTNPGFVVEGIHRTAGWPRLATGWFYHPIFTVKQFLNVYSLWEWKECILSFF